MESINLKYTDLASLDQLVEHALLALRDTLPAEENLTEHNLTIAIVGKDHPFKLMDDDEVKPYLQHIANVPRAGPGGAAAEPAIPPLEQMALD